MLVAGIFGNLTCQCFRNLVAALSMGMPAIALVLAAYQVTIFVEAGFFVLVTITFRGLASEGGLS